MRRPERQGILDLAGRTGTPADRQSDQVATEPGHVLDQKPQHPLAVARRHPRVVPDARQVGDQRRTRFFISGVTGGAVTTTGVEPVQAAGHTRGRQGRLVSGRQLRLAAGTVRCPLSMRFWG